MSERRVQNHKYAYEATILLRIGAKEPNTIEP